MAILTRAMIAAGAKAIMESVWADDLPMTATAAEYLAMEAYRAMEKAAQDAAPIDPGDEEVCECGGPPCQVSGPICRQRPLRDAVKDWGEP